MFYHTSVLDVEVTLRCRGRRARLSLEGNSPVPQQEEYGSGQPTLDDVCRIIKEVFRRLDRKLDVMAKDLKTVDQRVASLEHDTRQPRRALEADGQADTKTRERSEGTTTAVQAVRRDRCSVNRVDPDPMCSTSFGNDCTGPPAPPSHVSRP